MASEADQVKELRLMVGQLRPVLADKQGAGGYLSLFDEFVQEMEFELALHAVCDYLLEAETPPPEVGVIELIQTLHGSMRIEDDCLGRLQQKTA